MNKSDHPTVNERRRIREAPGPHFMKVSSVWSLIIGSPISPEQVVLCMAALKIIREAGAPGLDSDNINDAMGYLSLMPEVQMWVGTGPMSTQAMAQAQGAAVGVRTVVPGL